VRIYVQGAPETVINLCNFQFNINDPQNPVAQDRRFKNELLNNIIKENMAKGDERKEGLKVFSIAYRDISIADL
jgi:hypothetical protein